MPELQIKTETPPQRCEICHQSDYFDPQANYCSRCKSTTGIELKEKQPTGILRLLHSGHSKLVRMEDEMNHLVLFGGLEDRNNSKQFQGGKVTVMFGGAELDLCDADIEAKGAYLELITAFGGIELIVPEHW